ncbi:TonB-dependent siderophore receptor [Shewanella sp.]|uniref:TonB-dependent siderophore receptor n=1 Tax=Shewanella sp. TaxID=50422 RepID=UPI003A96AF49
MQWFRSAVSAVVVANLYHGVGYAAEQPDTDNIERISVVGSLQKNSSSATGLDLSIRETPQSVTVIDNSYIERFKLDTMNRVMEFTPGVTVEQAETDRSVLTARGFEISNIQIDGIGAPFYTDVLYGPTDMSLYERVEVVRGANGLTAGVGNPSATVNLVRKRPTAETRGYVSLSAGRWDNYRLEADVSGSMTDKVRGRFVGSYTDGNSYIDWYEKKLSSVYGVVETDLSNATLLTVGAQHQENKPNSPLWGALTTMYADGTPTDFPRSTSTSSNWAYWNIANTEAFAELKHDFLNGWEGVAQYSYRHQNQSGKLFYVTGTIQPETNAGLYGYASQYTADGDSHQVDLSLKGSYDLFGRSHELVMGAGWIRHELEDLSLYDADQDRGFPQIPDFTQWDGNAPVPVFDANPSGSDLTDTQSSVYIANRLHLTDKLTAIVGGRYIDYKSRGESYGANESSDESRFIPYGGLVYDLSANLSLYTSIAKTFRAQTEFDANHERLTPTKGQTLEGGIKGEFFDGALNVTAAVFDNDYKNLAESMGRNEQGQTYYRGADFESQGFEVEVNGQLTTELKLLASYTQQSIEDEQGEDTRTYLPEKSVKVMLQYTPEWLPELSMGTNARWQSSVYRDYGAARLNQGSYLLVGAFARYQVADNISVNLNIDNITDKTYYNSLNYGQAFYGTPMNYTASVRWSF